MLYLLLLSKVITSRAIERSYMEHPYIYVPIITSFSENDRLYIDGMKEIVNYLSESRIDGIWLLGSYGAFPLLSRSERMVVAEEIIPYAKSLNMSIIAHIGHPSTTQAVELAIHAQDCGANAVAAVVPFYYAVTHLREEHILAHFASIAEKLDIPLLFYNNATATGYSPSNSTIRNMLKIGIYGLKDKGDSVTMWERNQILRKYRKDGIYLSGTTSVMLQGHLIGAQGVVSGTALAEPRIVNMLHNALLEDDIQEAKRLQELVYQIRAIQGRYVGRAVSCYDILEAKGVYAGTCRMPWQRMSTERKREIIGELKGIEECL